MGSASIQREMSDEKTSQVGSMLARFTSSDSYQGDRLLHLYRVSVFSKTFSLSASCGTLLQLRLKIAHRVITFEATKHEVSLISAMDLNRDAWLSV